MHAGVNPHPGHAKAGDEADDVERQLPIDLATHEDEFSVSPLKHWQQLPVLLLAPF